jgi:hypothetical protein
MLRHHLIAVIWKSGRREGWAARASPFETPAIEETAGSSG